MEAAKLARSFDGGEEAEMQTQRRRYDVKRTNVLVTT
jgi:hypothetical protein